jgi:probable F420-dependent oxidoreductase
MQFVCPLPNLSQVKAVVQPWEKAMDGRRITAIAQRAEALGYDMLRTPEHFVVSNNHVDLSGPHYLHSVSAQGYLLGATQRIRVGASVTILPLQPAVLIAKALATIDWLSSGRLVAAFGVGWLKEEFEAMGVPFEKRGRIADEYLAATIELWTKDQPQFEGEFVSFKDIVFEPKPVQRPHIPIWIGADAEPALKRVARFATGWVPFTTPPDQFREKLDFIQSQPEYRGGRDFEVMFTLSSRLIGDGHYATGARNPDPRDAAQMVETFGWLGACGVTVGSFAIPPCRDEMEYLDYIQWFAEEVRPKVGREGG